MPDTLVIRGAREHDEDTMRRGQTRSGDMARRMKPPVAETPESYTGRFLAPPLGT